MRITELKEEHKETLWNLLKNNPAEFFFFHYDYSYNLNDVQFWIALKEDTIIGLMCLNKEGTVRMYGSSDIIEKFFEKLENTPRYISIPEASKHLIPNYVKSEKKRLIMHRLALIKKDISLTNKFTIIQLKKEDMKQALQVFKAAEPEDWMKTEAESLAFNQQNQWYGVKIEGRLASVCWNQVYTHGGHIAFIATHPEHQNQGLATELMKFVLKENFNVNDLSILHVSDDNKPALHIYLKLGYKQLFTSIVLCEPEMKKL